MTSAAEYPPLGPEPAPSTVSLGASAEDAAHAYLVAHGYQIVRRNYRAKIGELDLVAYDGATLVFIEVRSRANDDHGHAAEMVTSRKQRRVARVAQVYLLAERPIYENCRFDVVAITGGEIELIRDAFRLSR